MDDLLIVAARTDTGPSTPARTASVQLRVKFLITGVLFPISAFIVTASSPISISSLWQSGQLDAYVAMLMTWPGYGPFLPLVGCCMACLTLWLVRPASSRFLILRWCIYAGVALSFQFLVMTTIANGPFTYVFAALTAPVLALTVFAFNSILSRIGRFTIAHLLILTTIAALLIALIQWTGSGFESMELLLGLWFIGSAASPVLCLVTFIRASLYLRHERAASGGNLPSTLTPLGVGFLIAWIGSWWAAWVLATDIMMKEYAKLPTAAPNCYVTSAAAGGHRRLVASRPRHGDQILVNPQMQRLKFAEFAIATALPNTHASIRRCYDRIGPPLAHRCRSNIWFADATYVAFKPLEWAAIGLAKSMAISSKSIGALYSVDQRGGECED
ncbi:hypothetical protein K227x_27880 [Rubripirellula lacrimiformis]|uniref:DUF6688 domain-containing protein n=1 Tax=Rubripirellula lacrimiformis TaxID=1930273 RepID=A0A517NB81_9BACT|nr:DUF6688 family protein [Rubripirellula lacrimiformis]QDT04397.1 hypothetical protein K227x_27880 [Rubripirellula lacrimiformis]